MIAYDSLEDACGLIREKLIAGVEKRLVADAKVGFLLSGGLDSSLVCAIAARKSRQPIRTFAIGMSQDAIDLKYARQVADYIGSHHTEVYMTPEDILASLEEVIQLLGTYDITTIRASLGMYLVCKAIHQQTDIRVLLTGEISDELFGYKYTDFAPQFPGFPGGIPKAPAGAAHVRRAPGGPVHLRQLPGGPGTLWGFGLCLLRHGAGPRFEGEPLRQGQVPAAPRL